MSQKPHSCRDYPGSTGEFLAWFSTDDTCSALSRLAALARRVRVRPVRQSRRVVDGGRALAVLGVLAPDFGDGGHDLRLHAHAVDGVVPGSVVVRDAEGLEVSALGLQRTLEFGSCQTAWAILHRLRSVLTRPGRELLAGIVQVNETSIGGEEPGLKGRRARGKKALVAVAVEEHEPRGYGRCRMEIIDDDSRAGLHRFITENIAPGSGIITDGWSSYRSLDKLGYIHEPRNQSAAKARGVAPRATRIDREQLL